MSDHKRRKVAFAVDEEMPAADTDSYVQWAAWRDGPAQIAAAFLSTEERGVVAARSHQHLQQQGLDLSGVDLLAQWAAPQAESCEALMMLALYERATGLSLDLEDGQTSDFVPRSEAVGIPETARVR